MSQNIYHIRVKGYLDQERSSWLDGLTITHNGHGETILSGPIADQAALHGVLLKIRDLGLPLLEVTPNSSNNSSELEVHMNATHEVHTNTTKKAQPSLPKLWFQLSERGGNAVQLAGLILGAGLLYLAAHLAIADGVRIILMLLGWLVIYICCHAIAHWVVGRLVGIHFRGYGVRGTDHPENYPPGLRQLMSVIPFFSALTQKSSMQQASAVAKALMFSAGETSTNICSLLAAAYAWHSGIPGGFTLFIVTLFWDLGSTITVAIIPRGDYAKAIRVLRKASRA